MPIADDGDIVRGLGFVALYAAYMEEAIDECATVLLEHDPAPPESLGRRPISQKVQYAQERLAQHEQLPDDLSHFPRLLDYIADLLDRRNEVIHGRISMAACKAQVTNFAQADPKGARGLLARSNFTSWPTSFLRRWGRSTAPRGFRFHGFGVARHVCDAYDGIQASSIDSSLGARAHTHPTT